MIIMDFEFIDYCADCGEKLTESEKLNNMDKCNKCIILEEGTKQ